MLTQDQINFYNEHGYLRIPQVFSPAETDRLSEELDRLVQRNVLVAGRQNKVRCRRC